MSKTSAVWRLTMTRGVLDIYGTRAVTQRADVFFYIGSVRGEECSPTKRILQNAGQVAISVGNMLGLVWIACFVGQSAHDLDQHKERAVDFATLFQAHSTVASAICSLRARQVYEMQLCHLGARLRRITVFAHRLDLHQRRDDTMRA